MIAVLIIWRIHLSITVKIKDQCLSFVRNHNNNIPHNEVKFNSSENLELTILFYSLYWRGNILGERFHDHDYILDIKYSIIISKLHRKFL